MPYVRVEKKRRNPKYRPYGRDDRMASFEGAVPFGGLARWPVILLCVGILLLAVVLLPSPQTLMDRFQESIDGLFEQASP